MAKISIQDLVHVISDKHGITQKEAGALVTALFDVISAGLGTDRQVKVKGLGTFKVIDVRDRESVDVNTGERIVIDGRSKITFTPDTIMRDIVNRPFAQFETVVINEGVNIEDFLEVDRNYEADNVTASLEASGNEADDVIVDETLSSGEDIQVTEAVDTHTVTEQVAADSEQIVEKSESDTRQDEVYSENQVDTSGQESYNAEEDTDKECVESSDTETYFVQDSQNECNTVDDNEAECRDESEIQEDITEDDGRRRPLKILLYVVPICLLMVVGAMYVGYYWGKNEQGTKNVSVTSPQKSAAKKKPMVVAEKKDSIEKDTLKTQHKKDTFATGKHIVEKSATKKDAKEAERKNQEAESVAFSDKYDKANVMVRTGAYRIVGVERTVVLKKGQTLSSVSKAILGPGMECYIEALNGIKDAKEGQSLKIPKLEIRKKKK